MADTREVPREPTDAMIEAGWIATGPAPDIVPRKHYLAAMWRAMYDAAPVPAPPAEPTPEYVEARLQAYAVDLAEHGAGDEDTCRDCMKILRQVWDDAIAHAAPAAEPTVTTLAKRIGELAEKHGSLRAAARVLQIDHAYLWRLANGQKDNPDQALLRKLGLRQVVLYERTDAAPVTAPPAEPTYVCMECHAKMSLADVAAHRHAAPAAEPVAQHPPPRDLTPEMLAAVRNEYGAGSEMIDLAPGLWRLLLDAAEMPAPTPCAVCGGAEFVQRCVHCNASAGATAYLNAAQQPYEKP